MIRESFRLDDWRFTASHLANILVIPMDTLQAAASSGEVGESRAEVSVQLASD